MDLRNYLPNIWRKSAILLLFVFGQLRTVSARGLLCSRRWLREHGDRREAQPRECGYRNEASKNPAHRTAPGET